MSPRNPIPLNDDEGASGPPGDPIEDKGDIPPSGHIGPGGVFPRGIRPVELLYDDEFRNGGPPVRVVDGGVGNWARVPSVWRSISAGRQVPSLVGITSGIAG